MNFSVNRTLLLEAVQKAQAIVEKKITVPILGYLFFNVKDQTLFLSSTDLEIEMKITLAVESIQPGRFTLPAKQTLEILKELPNQFIQFREKENQWIEILCEKSKFTLPTLPADQYPVLLELEDRNYIPAKVGILKEMIDRTQFAASVDPTRHPINGIYFETLENQKYRMVATDGHRLSYVDKNPFLENSKFEGKFILSRKGSSELKKLLSNEEEIVYLALEPGHLHAHFNQVYLSIRLTEGDYPNYKGAIPERLDKKALIYRQVFIAALRRTSLLCKEKNKGLRLSLDRNSMLITSEHSEVGEAQEEIEIEYTGNPIEVRFNSDYLLECLAVMKSEKVALQLKDPRAPAVLTELGLEEHTYILMPIYSGREN